MLNPTIVRASVYAGLVSQTLAIFVCFIFKAWEHIGDGIMSLAFWVVAFLIHKKLGTW